MQLYASEILLALQELHRCDIVYRDLKPNPNPNPNASEILLALQELHRRDIV